MVILLTTKECAVTHKRNGPDGKNTLNGKNIPNVWKGILVTREGSGHESKVIGTDKGDVSTPLPDNRKIDPAEADTCPPFNYFAGGD